MSSPATARLAPAAPGFVERASATELADWLAYVDPDVLLVTGTSAAPRAANALRRVADPGTSVVDPDGRTPGGGPEAVSGVQFVFAPDVDALSSVGAVEKGGIDGDRATVVLSGLLELDVDRTALSTALVGREAYADALDPGALDGESVHVSTRLPAGYRCDWDGLQVVGGGVEAGVGGAPLVAIDCRADGQVLTRTLDPSSLGLRALDGVGETRAPRLREAGLADRESVADAELATLVDVDGFGRSTAERIRESATAVAEGTVIRRSEVPFPGGDPLYVDLETDGLNPTITWLVGVLDGSAADGTYHSFCQRDPSDPGGAIREFLSWYETTASGRPVVAYNGWRFDFTVLRDHVVQHCPEYEPVWNGIDRFDPYRWAVEEDNAVLPGRTNTLEDVAAALGYDGADTGLTGAAVARAYRRWMAEQSPETELDWDRFDAYCEDDVRALASVYEAIADSGRVVSGDRDGRPGTETGTQGTLSDW